MPAVAIEHALATGLVLIAIVSSAIAMAHVSYYEISLQVEGTAANAYAVEQTIFVTLSCARGLNCLDVDKLDALSSTYQKANPSLFEAYKTFLTEANIKNNEFHLWVSSGLNVSAGWMNSSISVSVLQPFTQQGIAAGIVAYIFNGNHVVETIYGETNTQGAGVVQPTQDGAILIFASNGASVGFAFVSGIVTPATDSTGVYVKGGQLLPQGPSSYFIFSRDGYTGPITTGMVDVSGYSLPVAVAWKDDTVNPPVICVLSYPHFPIDYGAPVSSTGFTLITSGTVQGSIVKVKLQVWGGAGELH
jgi:hypothetical protein